MEVNILTAIKNIAITPIAELRSYYAIHNRANSMGEALENYIKDVFAGTLAESDEQKRLMRFEQAFSYQGNQNNPPDIIIKNGDAIEVKKIESAGSSLALNSSYPKAKLFSNSPMITAVCRNCENWTEKDIIYAVGVVNKNHLKRLFFVYGVDYAASAEIYERIKTVICTGVNAISDVEISSTKELGRVNRVDLLGITYLRIREMWGIENPAKTFSYVYKPKTNADFEFAAIINTEKYNSFSNFQRAEFESIDGINIKDVKIKTPDNPNVLKNAKIITFCR
ncbi:MAG: NgoPII family restriction endonuclease [Oscillospiraceae bacterium]|nr:NgoPII family restriction endonuclease [Oscillospiraceae bacterium]